MAVYYKFKSARDYDSFPMDGPFISVGTLKDKIFESKHLGSGKDFDLVVTNAQTNEEYLDEATLIPKNTSVLIRRVPGRPRLPIVTEQEPRTEGKPGDTQPVNSDYAAADSSALNPEDLEWDEFGNDLYSIPEALPAQSCNPVPDAPAATKDDEESKIKALIDTPALDWQKQGLDGFGSGRGFVRVMSGRIGGPGLGRAGMERKTPPPGYVCHRCKIPGHFIQHCPTNGDPNYDIKRVKPPTGIPKSMLMATPDGSYALPSGAVAVLKPNEDAFEKAVEGLPSTRSIGELPPELHCSLCKEVMKDAVLTSKCCFKSFCDGCIRNYIISKSMCVCGATDILADDLLPNKTLRDTINRILESGTNSTENAGSTFQVQDMESARCPLPKLPSPCTSAASKGDQRPITDDAEEPKVKAADKVMNPMSHPQSTKEEVTAAKKMDPSEAESISLREATSRGSAPVPEEEVQQKLNPAEQGKKKKRKKARVAAPDMQWNAPQDLAADYMMLMAHSAFNPSWGGVQPGLDGFVGPYPGPMPYMGYGPGPLDMPSFGGVMPPGPFGPQGCMFPPIPPHRDRAELGMGMMNMPPPVMSREEFEARKADVRRKRENERRSESEFSRDREYYREERGDAGAPSMKPKPKKILPSSSGDHRHRTERHSVDGSGRDLEPQPRPSKRRSQYHPDYYDADHYLVHERPKSRDHGHERERPRDHDPEPNHDHDNDRRHHHRHQHRHHHHRLEPSSSKPTLDMKTPSEPKSTSESAAAADRKHKASVFSRISFPEGEVTGEKGKASSSPRTTTPAPAPHHEGRYETSAEDYESSDEDRHFKRKPSRYEPSPPPPVAAEWEDKEPPRHSRTSRERQRNRYGKHR